MTSSNPLLKALSNFFKPFQPSSDQEPPAATERDSVEAATIPVTTRPRDVQVASIGENTTVLRSRTWDRLKFEVEYGRQTGTTANSYLIQADKSALIDPPGESFTEIFLAAIALRAVFAEGEAQINPVRGDEVLDLGQGHELRFVFVPTPRWPDALCTYDPATRIVFSDKFFGAHVCDEPVFDENWKQLDEDRRYYFDCLHAAQSRQVEAALDKFATFTTAKLYAPGHGPIVRYSFSRLTYDYRNWSQQQHTRDLTVALLYTSAYGKTAAIGQAIAKGITQTGVNVESVNCEFAEPGEITRLIEECDGFIIGS